jgi:hypothetical protein
VRVFVAMHATDTPLSRAGGHGKGGCRHRPILRARLAVAIRRRNVKPRRRRWPGQLPRLWKSVSDSKSTATCRPSSDLDRYCVEAKPVGSKSAGFNNAEAPDRGWPGLYTGNPAGSRNERRGSLAPLCVLWGRKGRRGRESNAPGPAGVPIHATPRRPLRAAGSVAPSCAIGSPGPQKITMSSPSAS